jgi:hypothetical protein
MRFQLLESVLERTKDVCSLPPDEFRSLQKDLSCLETSGSGFLAFLVYARVVHDFGNASVFPVKNKTLPKEFIEHCSARATILWNQRGASRFSRDKQDTIDSLYHQFVKPHEAIQYE